MSFGLVLVSLCGHLKDIPARGLFYLVGEVSNLGGELEFGNLFLSRLIPD